MPMQRKKTIVISALAIITMVWVSCMDASEKQELPEQVSYNFHIRPILSDKCFVCHGPDVAQMQAGLRLDAAGVGRFDGVEPELVEQLREGIKSFSDWPTIPQLYVKGEFVGGSDIIREMFQSGELKTFLDEQGLLPA